MAPHFASFGTSTTFIPKSSTSSEHQFFPEKRSCFTGLIGPWPCRPQNCHDPRFQEEWQRMGRGSAVETCNPWTSPASRWFDPCLSGGQRHRWREKVPKTTAKWWMLFTSFYYLGFSQKQTYRFGKQWKKHEKNMFILSNYRLYYWVLHALMGSKYWTFAGLEYVQLDFRKTEKKPGDQWWPGGKRWCTGKCWLRRWPWCLCVSVCVCRWPLAVKQASTLWFACQTKCYSLSFLLATKKAVLDSWLNWIDSWLHWNELVRRWPWFCARRWPGSVCTDDWRPCGQMTVICVRRWPSHQDLCHCEPLGFDDLDHRLGHGSMLLARRLDQTI